MSAVYLRAYSRTGTYLGELPDLKSLRFQDELGKAGGGSFVYPPNGLNYSLLLAADPPTVRVVLDGREIGGGRIESDSEDTASDERLLTCNFRGFLALLDLACTHPADTLSYTTATFGTIVTTLVNQAKARGTIPEVQLTFASGTDTAAQAWAQTQTVQYGVGTSLLQIVESLVELGLAEIQTIPNPTSAGGMSLRAFTPGTNIARDQTATVRFHRAQAIGQAVRRRDRRLQGNVIVARGETGTYTTVDGTSVTTYGRIEKAIQVGGPSTTAALGVASGQYLTEHKDPIQGFNFTVGEGSPYAAWDVYMPGDYVGVDYDGKLESRRIYAMTLDYSEDGETTISVETDRILSEYDVRAARAAAASAAGGSVVTPESGGMV